MVAQPLNIGGAAAAQNQYNISNISGLAPLS